MQAASTVDMQVWYLLNVDKKQMSNDGPDWFDVLSVTLSGRDDEQLCRSLFPPCLSPQVDIWCKNDAMVAQTSVLFVLPPELLGAIFLQLTELHHTVAFAITCRYLLCVGKQYILRAAREFYAPWAGCRLICIGSQTADNDLPPGMLTTEEENEVAAWSKHAKLGSKADLSDINDHSRSTGSTPHNSGDSDEDEEPMGRGFLGYVYGNYRLALSRIWAIRRSEDAVRFLEYTKWDDLHRNQQGDLLQTQQHDHSLFNAVLGLRPVPQFPWEHLGIPDPMYPSGIRVMCSLTKGEYVREDRLTVAGPPQKKVPVTWCHVLLSLICWSSVPISNITMSEEHAKHFYHGRWAGDRIIMAVLEQLPEIEHEAAGNDWKDVSQHVDELLHDMWSQRDAPAIVDSVGCCPIRYTEWAIRRGDQNQVQGSSRVEGVVA